MKTIQNKFRISPLKFIFILLCSISFTTLQAQIQGGLSCGCIPNSEQQGQTYTYYLGLSGTPASVSWLLPLGGTTVSSSDYLINVLWAQAGTHVIVAYVIDVFGNTTQIELYVTVTATAPSTPSVPTIQSSNCGNTILARGAPPGGVTWYWQSSTSGTSTSNSSATITKTSGTIQYLRARNSSGTWSSNSSSKSYSITQPTTWYQDSDGDGLGDPNATQSACSQPSGFVSNNSDQCPSQSGSSPNNGCPEVAESVLSDENYVYTVVPRDPTTDIATLENNQKVENVTYYDGLGRPMQSIGIRAGGKSEDVVTHIGYDDYGRQTEEYLPYTSSTDIGNYRAGALIATNSFYDAPPYEADFPGVALNDINAYSKKGLEASPLSRVLKQAAPGKDWALGEGHEIEFDYSSNTASDQIRLFEANITISTDNYPQGDITLFTPSLTGGTTYYTVGELYKTVTYDENHSAGVAHSSEEFKDKQGRVILKRTYGTSVVNGSTQANTQHDTYYVYDDYGNLSYVIPPKVDTSDGVSTTELLELCYQYMYDDRNRLVEKTIPGKTKEKIVYDKLDRPIMTLAGGDYWLFTKYDAFGRVSYTGISGFYYIAPRGYLQAQANSTSATFETKTTPNNLGGATINYTNSSYPTIINEVQTINYYDDYDFDGFTNIPSSYDGQTIVNHDDNDALKTKGLATGSKVRVLNSDPVQWITAITGYNEKAEAIYIKSDNPYLGTTDVVKSTLGFTGEVYKTVSEHTKSGNTITTTDFFTYDHAGRLSSHEQDINGAQKNLIARNVYDRLGQLEKKHVGSAIPFVSSYTNTNFVTISDTQITKVGSTSYPSGLSTQANIPGNGYINFSIPQNYYYIVVGLSYSDVNFTANSIQYGINIGSNGQARVYEAGVPKGNSIPYLAGDNFRVERKNNIIYYSKNGKVFYVSKSISNGNTMIGDATLISTNSKLENFIIVDTDKALQTVDYAYNVRGWLKEINKVNSLGNDLFGFKINYNTTDHNATKLYNGNIAETQWKTQNDNMLRYYNYSYDALNRIKTGAYNNQASNETGWFNVTNISYDKNGNLLSLNRAKKGTPSAGAASDYLTYFYNAGNKLLKVEEQYDGAGSFEDGTNTGDDYTYDVKGNMLTDANKGIFNNITYNHLNLPIIIPISSGAIYYIYDATGVKLEKKVVEYLKPNKYTFYAGNYIYDRTGDTGEGSLKFFNHPEGYFDVTNPPTSGELEGDYVYQYKDHLGNVRLSYSDTDGNGSITAATEILEENNYYPFGLRHKGYNNVVNSTNPALKKKFAGEEFEDDLGKNTVAYQWRDYDPAIGRFNKIDRFAEKYYSLTPYHFTANNPILYNEIAGDSIGRGREHYDRFRQNAVDERQGMLDKRQEKLAGAQGNENKTARLTERYARQDANANSRINVLGQAITELDALESSSQTYNLVVNSDDTGSFDGNINYDTSTNEVNVNLKGGYNTGMFAHELKHAYQFETGKLSFNANGSGGILYDVQDEVEAYARGSFFGAQNKSVSEIKEAYGSISSRTTQRTLQTNANVLGQTYLQLWRQQNTLGNGTQYYNPPPQN